MSQDDAHCHIHQNDPRTLKAPGHCTPPLPIPIVITALVLRDKMLAHSTYRNQWTSSGEKKLVVDASKVKLVLGFLLVVVIMWQF